MSFPKQKYNSIAAYAEDYFKEIQLAYSSIDDSQLSQAIDILTDVYTKGGMVFSCGKITIKSERNRLLELDNDSLFVEKSLSYLEKVTFQR